MKWALVGASTIASQHMISAIRAQQGHSITSVLSSSDERGRSYADAHDIRRAFTDLNEQLRGDADAVYISTTNEKHFPQAMAAIDAG